jgi:sugar lactone lactonase YvrE
MKERGFILIGMFFMLVLMAVTAVALNRRAGLQSQMAANQTKAVRTHLGQEAAIEQAVWQLTKDPFWRTASSGEDYTYNGVTYNRKVLNTTLSGYADAITLSVMAPGSLKPLKASFRYYLTDIQFLAKPNQISCDTWNNIYIASRDNHSIFRVEGSTGAMTRVAGNGTSGFSGDGGPATDAQLKNPSGVHVDAFGVIYIADTENERIRKVDLTGTISTIAGTGSGGFEGDAGAATNAKLKKPRGVAVDSQRNIYIADTDNHCIRKIDTSGVITTVAGIGGQAGYSGNNGPATEAKLDKPIGVFVDNSENIYIADTNNHRIRKVDGSGIITTIAGCGPYNFPLCSNEGSGELAISTRLQTPCGVYVDTTSGNIYIGDTYGNRIRRFVEGGDMDTVAGTGAAGYSGDGGPATSAKMDLPWVAVRKSTGEMVISDWMNSCLRQVDLGDTISTLTGTGAPGFNRPEHIAMDGSGNVYIADKDNHRIRKLDTSGRVTTVAGTGSAGYNGDGILAISAQLNKPCGVALDTLGNIYIGDTDNHRVRRVDKAGTITTVAGTGIFGYSPGGPATSAKLDNPEGVAVITVGAGPNVIIYIADRDNHLIRRVDEAGVIGDVAGTPKTSGYGGDNGPATSALLDKPQGVAFDSAKNIYIADTDNHCIRKVKTTGDIVTVAGIGDQSGNEGDGGPATSAKMNKPVDVFVDFAGNLFIADRDNNRIRVVSALDDKIYGLAGTGTGGFNGDDQPAVEAQLNKPCGVSMAATRGGRTIYVSDRDNDRVRMLTFKSLKELY